MKLSKEDVSRFSATCARKVNSKIQYIKNLYLHLLCYSVVHAQRGKQTDTEVAFLRLNQMLEAFYAIFLMRYVGQRDRS